MKLFKAYCTAKSEDRPIKSLSPIELDSILAIFSLMWKKNWNDYKPSSVRGFVSNLDWYLKGKRYPHQVNKNNLFPHVNSTLRAKKQYLKSQGHGNRPNESDELTDNDTEKLCEGGQLGVNTTAGYKSSASFFSFDAWYAWWTRTKKSEMGET